MSNTHVTIINIIISSIDTRNDPLDDNRKNDNIHSKFITWLSKKCSLVRAPSPVPILPSYQEQHEQRNGLSSLNASFDGGLNGLHNFEVLLYNVHNMSNIK